MDIDCDIKDAAFRPDDSLQKDKRPSLKGMADETDRTTSKELLDFRLHLKRLEIIDTAVREGIPWLFGAVIAFCTYLSIAVLAGKYTFAQIGVSVLGNIKISESISYVFGLSGVLYGLKERRLRRKNIQRLSTQIQTLERQKHPNLSSSNLTQRGTTQPEDK
jgi:hypothetical protein